ncbi:hypothetical protein [Streptosporangium minutum]|uniref:Uncharacterized protein n=1 Tax=Streptosporangium minutum TaxID=569862 RepID=A0A243RHX2_9ACTN|nr:hypothetical protein [Streptosporangium minutum]OUC94440.1 hypothetical protein CA984_22260 [Streptosporangium minutum]
MTIDTHTKIIDVARYGVALLLCATPPQMAADLLDGLAASGLPDAADLASLIPNKRIDKYDDVIGENLLTRSYAARKLDVSGTEQAIARCRGSHLRLIGEVANRI